jgi:hypothetical protein
MAETWQAHREYIVVAGINFADPVEGAKFAAAVASAVASGVAGNLAYDLLKNGFKRSKWVKDPSAEDGIAKIGIRVAAANADEALNRLAIVSIRERCRDMDLYVPAEDELRVQHWERSDDRDW